MKLTKQQKAFSTFTAEFAALCRKYGGIFNEQLAPSGPDTAFIIPTVYGPLRASIHAPYYAGESRRGSKIESVYLRFETKTGGKVYDSLFGKDFNGWSGKWNITFEAATTNDARMLCLAELETRLNRLAQEAKSPFPTLTTKPDRKSKQ